MATNITAIGFISKDIEQKQRAFINGLVYTLGRAITYVVVALIIWLGADQFHLSGFIQRYGEKFLGPMLIIIGLFMLDIIKLNLPSVSKLTSVMENRKSWSYLHVLLLGILFALAFCPYSGVLYFGMLIPMTVASASGLYLPVIFAIATGIPVILFAWILAYAVSGIGNAYNKVKVFEFYFRRVISLLFVLVGIYYILKVNLALFS